MGMNVGSSDGDEEEAISTINTTPLVDVMLVLLIIFLVTIPVITQNVAVKLPVETNVARQTKPENIEISVSRDGDIFWGVQPLRDNEDMAGRYEFVGRVVFAAQRAGIQKVGFVTEPAPRGG
jgi:biopolymer transport protein ExbD